MGRIRIKASLLSRVSTLAVLAAAGSLGAAQQAQADCNGGNVLNINTATTVTGAHACAFSAFVAGDVTNNGTIGPAGDGDYGFFVGKGGISGFLQNNGIITGGGPIYGALTIEANVAGGVRNDGIISSVTGAGIQLGWGTSDVGASALMEGDITNSGAITSTLGDGVAAWYGTMSGALINEDDGTISGGNRGVYIAEDFDSWSGGIFNAGQIQGNTAGIQIGDISPDGGGEGVSFSGGITNNLGGTINSLTGPTVAVGGSSFEDGIDNFGLITQRDEAAAGGEGTYAGVGILVTADTFAGGIENTGEIDGLGGPAIWITNGTTSFEGGIQNSGIISGADDAVRIESGSFGGGLFNGTFAEIVASTGAGVYANAVNWTGDVQNNGLIQGGPEGAGFHFLFGNYTGDFRNAGSIDGGFAGVFIDAVETLQGAGGEGSAAEFRNTGSITGGVYGVYVVGGVVDANFTNTTADPLNLPPGVISGESGAGLVLAATDSWTGDITNDGTISGVFGAVVGGVPVFGEGTFVSSTEGDFDGAITNNGVIDGDFVGLTVTGVNVTSDLTNTGLIEGGSNGLVVEVGTWTGDITNTATGVIRGIDTGALISANLFEGDIVNDGLIEGSGLDTGLHIVTDTHSGNIVNNGELSALSNALHVQISSELEGSITNTGLIEATGGGTAVRLEINNGATFVNTAGGTILGDVVFGGKAPYDFIAEDGGIEGSLFGETGGFGGEGGEGGFNDDVITVQNGTHYFVFEGKSGTASNFASFNVEDGGVAVMGARFVGDTAGTGYAFNNVDALNVNDGGQLYLDKSTQLDVGTYAQEAGGTTTFFLAAPADGGEFALAATAATPGIDYGQIIASGPVNLNGTVAAVLDPLSFAGTGLTEIEYNDVIVGTSLTGDFNDDQIFGDSYFFSLSHVLDGNTVDLRLSRTGFNNIPCLNANNDSFGNALETIFNSGGPINENLFQFLSGLSESDVCSSYDDIGGTVLADLGAVVVETAGPWKNMVNDRLNGIGSGSCGLASAGGGSCFNRFAANEVGGGQVMTDATPGDDPFSWLRTGVRRVGETAAWGRLIGVWGDTSGSAGVAGTDFQISGAIVGVDHVFTPVLLAGVAAQWTSNEIDFDGRRDNADVDSFEFGAYASYGDTRFYVNANASYIWHDFGVHRTVLGQSAIGDYSGTTLSAYLEAGKIFETDNWRIQPLVAVSYAHLETDDYSEVGSAIDLLNVKGTEFDSLKGMVGARVAYPIEMKSGRKIVPEGRIVWAHEFMDDHSTFTASLQSAPNVPFIVKGQEYARDTVIVGAGLTAPIADSTSLFLDYDAGINPDITTHTVSVGFRMRW